MYLKNSLYHFVHWLTLSSLRPPSMPEAGPPSGLFASFLYSVKVHLALDVRLFHLSLDTNFFKFYFPLCKDKIKSENTPKNCCTQHY